MKRLSALLMILSISIVLFAGCASSEKPAKLLTEFEGEYTISLPACGQDIHVHESYIAYMPYVSNDLINEADQALSEVMEKYPDDHPGFYLTFDEDGYLCLCTEIIVYFEPEKEGMSGCGFDHDHVFYRERISTEPVK